MNAYFKLCEIHSKTCMKERECSIMLMANLKLEISTYFLAIALDIKCWRLI